MFNAPPGLAVRIGLTGIEKTPLSRFAGRLWNKLVCLHIHLWVKLDLQVLGMRLPGVLDEENIRS